MLSARQLAAQELLRRRRASDGLYEFCSVVRPGYAPGAHHRTLCDALDALERREIRRLIVEMPPRHGKSYHVSEGFPARYLGRHPHHSVITTSHSDRQARRFGRKVRGLVASEAYQRVFPGTRLDPRANASDEFATQAGGLYLAVSIHGSFMGTGADLLVVDDTFRSRADAESPAIRDKVRSAYDDLENRLEPDAVVVVLMTRWHSDDLIGRIEKERITTGVEHWERITMPLIAHEDPNWEQHEQKPSAAGRSAQEREQALWPERYDIEACRAIRRRVPMRTWCSVYQQGPAALRGDFFHVDCIERFDRTAKPEQGGPPAELNYYITCDYGVKEGGDTTELYLVGIDSRNHWWVFECWAGSEKTDVWCAALVDMVVDHRPDGITGEAGVIRRAVEPFLEVMLDEVGESPTFHWAVRSSNKPAMAVPLQGIVQKRRLHVAASAWGDKLVACMRAFPTSADDHGVDALVNLAQCMRQTPGAFASVPENEEYVPDRWERLMRRARQGGNSSWKTA